MPESLSHKQLVRNLRLWIEKNYQHREVVFLWIDNCPEEGFIQPKRIGSYIPDVFARCMTDGLEIIGEAKTGNDIQSRHSEEQFIGYLRHCKLNGSLFVLSIPYLYRAFSKTLIKFLRTENSAQAANFIIIDNLSIK